MPPVLGALREVVSFLTRQQAEFMPMGGLAVRILALPRTTFDVDVMLGIGEEDVRHLAEAADAAGYQVDEAFRRGHVDRLAGLGKIHFHVLEGDRPVRVDVFLLGSEYQRAAFSRRRDQTTELGPLPVISPEDLLLHKLLADRPRDRSDVADLLLVCGPLESAYLSHWASHLGIGERLRAALAAAGRTS